MRRNSSITAKVAVRKNLIRLLDVDDPWILDAFCGAGSMHREAYNSTKNYLGLDVNFYDDDRKTIVCDNTRMLRQLDIEPFDIFDLDAYGSPLNAFVLICSRLKWGTKSKVGVVMTEGSGLNAKWNNLAKEIFTFVDMKEHKKTRFQHEEKDTILFMAIIKGGQLANAEIKHLEVLTKETRKDSGCPIRYVSFVMEKKENDVS